MMKNWPTATSMTDATGTPVLAAGVSGGRETMNGQARGREPSYRTGVRRTLWIAGTIAVAFFLLSILSMLKIG
ncbi:MAG TPA: hypothetical protein VGU03_09635 [Frateuria sp.]|uniref:hypothetical protein n=1 Tax=Frateuria sp. TaxID=2211372 RepID=UPI002DE7C914|nr:hypothetical protein [Frateuria sp.]